MALKASWVCYQQVLSSKFLAFNGTSLTPVGCWQSPPLLPHSHLSSPTSWKEIVFKGGWSFYWGPLSSEVWASSPSPANSLIYLPQYLLPNVPHTLAVKLWPLNAGWLAEVFLFSGGFASVFSWHRQHISLWHFPSPSLYHSFSFAISYSNGCDPTKAVSFWKAQHVTAFLNIPRLAWRVWNISPLVFGAWMEEHGPRVEQKGLRQDLRLLKALPVTKIRLNVTSPRDSTREIKWGLGGWRENPSPWTARSRRGTRSRC